MIFLTPTVHGEPRKEHFSLLVSAVERTESFPAINGGLRESEADEEMALNNKEKTTNYAGMSFRKMGLTFPGRLL